MHDTRQTPALPTALRITRHSVRPEAPAGAVGPVVRTERHGISSSAHIHLVGTPLWQLFRGGHCMECRVEQIPRGFEARCLLDGRLLISYQFNGLDRAFEFADHRYASMETRGWSRRAA